jgi:hypothetical protein
MSTTPVLEGQQTVMTVTIKNTSTQNGQPVAVLLTTKITVVTTDGTVVLPLTTLTDSYAAGGSKTYTYTLTAPIGKGGQNLQGLAMVYDPNGNLLNSGTGTEAITTATASGTVGPGLIWYEPLAGWESLVSGRQVPAGVEIWLLPMWKNNSSFNIVGHVALVVDGVAISADLNQDQEAAPGNGWQVRFPVGMLSAGTHTCVATLSSGGQVLDTETFTLVAYTPVILWTYGTPAIDANWQVGVSYFNWIRYRCQITNPSSQAVAKAISLMYKLKIPPSATFQGVTIFKTYNPPIPLGPFYGSTNIPQADLAAVIAWYIAGGFENLYGNFYNQSVASQNAAWQAWISATGKVYPSGILIPVGGSYQFDSCGIEGITGPGYSATGGETINGYRGGGWIYEVWLRDADGTESTHLQVST